MKKIYISLSLCVMTLGASIGSSVKVPMTEHMKYTFGNHKKHPVQKLEKERFLRSIAPLSEDAVQISLESKGYSIERIELRDIASELVYEVYAKTAAADHVKLYIDPANGSLLKNELLK